ncbi:MAG: hypothetical protein Q9191_008147 [Dirinaria sp. TL-2023a]
MALRATIPETPRYIYDVERNPSKGSHAVEAMTHEGDPEFGELSKDEDLLPPEPSLNDFMDYFFRRGDKWYRRNWTTLLGTAGTWFLLDFAFFGLGLNSPQIVTGLYKGCQPNNTTLNALADNVWNSEPTISDNPVSLFEDNEFAFWLIVSIGAIMGSLALIWLVDHISRRWLQCGAFVGLGLLFFVVGSILLHEIMYHYGGAWFVIRGRNVDRGGGDILPHSRSTVFKQREQDIRRTSKRPRTTDGKPSSIGFFAKQQLFRGGNCRSRDYNPDSGSRY